MFTTELSFTKRASSVTAYLALLSAIGLTSIAFGQTDTWKGGAGDWSNGGMWTAGLPGATSNVFIDGGNSLVSPVTLDINSTINNLTIDSDDSLMISDNHALTINGNITNNDSTKGILLNSAGNGTKLIIGGSNVTLSGTGTLTMGNQPTNIITGSVGTNTLTNKETIQGAGNIGAGQLTLVNSGTINADAGPGQNVLYIQTSGGTTNTGTLEATNGSTLGLLGSTFTNTGGTIKAVGSGALVNLQSGVAIAGGTLTDSGGGVIETVNADSATFNGVTNTGTLKVHDNSTLFLQGTITNSGSLQVNSAGNATYLEMSGNVTLTGTGTVSMDNQAPNVIRGASTGKEVLTNQQTIQGAGNIGDDFMTLVNRGTIDANAGAGQNVLYVQTSAGTTNTGMLEATSGSTLSLYGNTFTNTGGTITAVGPGALVILQNGVTIAGGTLTDSGGGVIESVNADSATLDGSAHTITNSGTFSVHDNSTVTLLGTINNTGSIQLNSAGNDTYLRIGNTVYNTSLTGGGTVVMGNHAPNIIVGAAASNVLTNVNNTISGAGNIGDGSMALNNQSVIDANAGAGQNVLYINTSNGTTNTGTLEATAGSTLSLYGDSYTNTGGTIQALNNSGSGSVVLLQHGVTINGGTLTTTGNGVIETVNADSATLNAVTNTGSVIVHDNSTLFLQGTITNNGTLQLNSAGNATNLEMSGNVTLAGTGTVSLDNQAPNLIRGASTGKEVLTNQQTIQGAGDIGGNFMALVNRGTIDANAGAGQNVLVIYTNNGTTNTGTLEATNGSTLSLLGNAFANTGGTIKAVGPSAAVNLQGDVTIAGGTLTDSGGGVIETVNADSATLSGVTNTGAISVHDNSSLLLQGTITNSGTLQLNSAGNDTFLRMNGNVSLTGKGTVVMDNQAPNIIVGAAAGNVLTNVNNTISGAGNIGDGSMALNNQGVIDANAGAGQNVLYINTSNGTTNTGTLEATAGSTLSLYGDTYTNARGTIQALNNSGAGSVVLLQHGVTIDGGTLTTTGNGVIETVNADSATLNGVTNTGTVIAHDNSTLTLAGTVTNNGALQINSAGNATDLDISGSVTLTGNGTVLMDNLPTNLIRGASGAGTEILTSANTIEGAGNIGDAIMGLVNTGTIIANQTNTLYIDVSSKNFDNIGTLEALAGTGNLQILGPSGSTTFFTNYSGTASSLTGGNYVANGGDILWNGGSGPGIKTLAASVREEAGGQLLNTGNGNANFLANLTAITAAGSFTTDVNFSDRGSFSNAGSLTILPSTTWNVASLSQIIGSTLNGGTYVLDSNLEITGTPVSITTDSAHLTLAGGTILNTSNSTNALANLNTIGSAGSLALQNKANFTTAGNFTNNGALTVNGGSTFAVKSGSSLTNFSGTTDTLTSGTFTVGGTLKWSGATIVTNAANLTLTGGSGEILNSTSSANALANFAANNSSGSLTLAGNENFTTGGNFTNNGRLTVNSGSTFAVKSGSSLTNFSGTTDTLTGGTFTVGGTLKWSGATIVTNASNLTLTGGSGQILNSTNNANALANFATNNSSGSLTLAGNQNFTTGGNFTNNGRLTVNSGSTFAVKSGSSLTNFNGATNTLTGGTFTVGGTLEFTGANIVTDAANITLTGSASKIINQSGANGLANFASTASLGSFSLSSGRSFSTVGKFSNAGTLSIASGTGFTVGGTGVFTQTAGTTTDGGTITDSGGFNLMGGKLFGNGTVAGAVNNSTGTITPGNSSTVTGILTDKGAYSQSANGILDVSVGGTTAGTQFDQLNPTKATLNGTLNVGLINGFVPAIGQTFKIMNFTSETGMFAHCTCAINSSEHFAITYQATDVLLTVVAGSGGNFALTRTLPQPAPFAGSAFSAAMPSSLSNNLRAAPAVSDFQAASSGIPSAPIFFRNDLRLTSGTNSVGLGAARGARTQTMLGNAMGARRVNASGLRSRAVVGGLSWRWSLSNLLSTPKPELAVY